MTQESEMDPSINPAARNEWIESHTLEFLYQNAIPATFGSLAVSCLLSWVIHNTDNFYYLVPWVFACFVVAFMRGVLVYYYRSHKAEKSQTLWFTFFRLVNCFSGIIIGSAAWLFIPYASASDKVLILCAIVGLIAGATPSYSVDMRAFLAFILPSCLLPVLFYSRETPEGYGAIIGMFILYLAAMLRVASQSRESLKNNFELSFSLNYRATHDALSGLLNRQELENQFTMLTPNTRHGVAMLFMDLDHFKLLNDSLGHQAGDDALRKVAEIIRNHIRDDDICARLGGDEFVALLFLDDPSIAEKIGRAVISDINALDFDNADFPGLGCSVGVAFKSNNAISYSNLMKEADSACYASKDSGKNQVTYRAVS